MDLSRNNLDKSTSPYLLQHKDNPVHWQEWSEELIEYAKEVDKPLFVSVGYATCHWCHVMAAEAFSHKESADYLNEHFIPIKIDREQRPDIDRYLMEFLVATRRSGGWPLNAFLSPEMKPFAAFTYIPIKAKYGMPPFLQIIQQVKRFYDAEKKNLTPYDPSGRMPGDLGEERLIPLIRGNFDEVFKGWGSGNKFPPHNTLLFLQYYYRWKPDTPVDDMITETLDTMMLRGLHDNLQGGFHRYCVDDKWTIPHFEKMLYDQAMLLWNYSLAYDVFGKKEYAQVARGIVKCLKETYLEDGLFVSAHDADTDHVEGETYLWTERELKKLLNKKELKAFLDHYEITKKGNFEGKNHLIRKKTGYGKEISAIEEKLLEVRRKRVQPFTDRKKVTSWNALAGIGLLMAGK